jgi:hypothetical protein
MLYPLSYGRNGQPLYPRKLPETSARTVHAGIGKSGLVPALADPEDRRVGVCVDRRGEVARRRQAVDQGLQPPARWYSA